MAVLRSRSFATRGVYADIQAFRDAIRDGFRKEIHPEVEAVANEITADWKVSPRWDHYEDITPRAIVEYLYPVGRGSDAWRWVSHGVPGRLIVVKKTWTHRGIGNYKPTLKLQRYYPHTRPGGYWGGPGMYYGEPAYRQAVWWPGIAPRNFEWHIAREVDHIAASERIVRRAVRAAQRQGA